MKRPIARAITLTALAILAAATATGSPLVLDKSLRGEITPDRLSLTLSSAGCDATGAAIPDGSVLTTDRFTLNAGDDGIGFFAGLVRIVTPDGRVVARGALRGTVGLYERSDAADCVIPDRLEGMVQAIPAPSPVRVEADAINADLAPPGILLHLRADRVPQATVPRYEGRLYGLFSPTDAPGQVLVRADRPAVPADEPVRGIVSNRASRSIASLPDASYCTILSLERRVDDRWEAVGPCAYIREPDPVVIPANSTLVVPLPPASPGGHEPGVYRLALTYTIVDGDPTDADAMHRSISPEFRILPLAPPAGYVRVDPGRAAYRLDEPIQAGVTNLIRAPIQGHAWHSYCTILQLQRRVNDGWTVEAACMLTGGPTISIAPGETHKVMLPPSNAGETRHPPGVYRLVFQYEVVDPTTGQPIGEPREAVSPTFQVGPSTAPASLSVSADRPAYAVTDTLTAVLRNGPAPVSILNGETMCTIVQLQKAEPSGWRKVAPCLLAVLPTPTLLKPNEARTVPLMRDAPWEPGRYRFAVTYSAVEADGSAGERRRTVFSRPFIVGLNTTPFPAQTNRLPAMRP